MSSSRFPSISLPYHCMLRVDALMEISYEKKYDKTSHPVLSESCGQLIRMLRLEMVDYTQEEVYLKLSRIFDPRCTLLTLVKSTASTWWRPCMSRGPTTATDSW